MENKVLSPGIPEEASALIVVKQLPIIEQRLQEINAEITERVTTALKLAVTEETVKSVKKVRADLKKTFTELETCRKDVKAAVLAPYQEFEAAYKKYVTDVFKPADEQLAGKIAEVEEGLKAKIGQEIAEYYDELAASLGIDFLPFGMSGISITLSASKKALREQANKLLVQISENMSMVENQDHAEEILVEYKKDPFNVARAISTVQERHRAIEVEQDRRARAAEFEANRKRTAQQVEEAAAAWGAPQPVEEPEEAPAPVADSERRFTFRFTIFDATREQAVALKKFLKEGNYHYE